MLQNNEIIYKKYLEMKVIHQSYLLAGDRHDFFLYKASNNLCLKGYKIIKKWQINASLVFHKVFEDQSIIFFAMKNNQLYYVFGKIKMIHVHVIFPM